MTIISPINTYLTRIGLNAPVSLDPAGLHALQAAHRQSIPFENLCVRLGNAITCESGAVFDKLVTQNRGGFCFEHNQLFADMLGALGFDVRLLLARVLLGGPDALPPLTHCLVLLRLDGEHWIADAGFGGSYAPPMPLRNGALAQSGDTARHRLRCLGADGALPGSWILERKGPVLATDGRAKSDDDWEPQYAFDLAEVAPADMALGCHWSATHPSSRFTNLTVVSCCLPEGFVSIVDSELTRWQKNAAPEKTKIPSAATYRERLLEEFGIAITAQETAALSLF